jgi:FAD/FMN-containing dehydrogenase
MSNIETAISALKTGFSGTLVRPGDAAYDARRLVVAGGVDKRPGVIAEVKNAADVAAVINAARDGGIELAVRSGGHSGAGYSTTEGGIVLDLRGMKAIEIDVASRTAWVETGATAMEVMQATLAHGAIIGFGDAGSVGVGGITLGGGVGYLVRKWGMTIDALLAAEIVTADGKFHAIDATHEPDLFWAIRGGGGNFGVVTRLRFALQPLPAFTGGMIALPATAETVAGFVAAAEMAPDELSTIANVMTAPPLPFLPPEVHGKLIIMGMLAFAGDDAAAQRAIAPFRALAKPYADMVKPGPYTSLYPPEDPNYRPTAAVRSFFMDHIGINEAGTIVQTLESGTAAFKAVQIRVLGGAYARVPADATAYAHRNASIMLNLVAFHGPDDKAEQVAWVERFMAALMQRETGVYSNFLTDEGEERVHAAYPGATWDRLAEIKAAVDPDNLFRLNQNIAPAQ